ncbi:MAG: tetratricopeptide repeat protein [Alphaproteobacteria bacterium]|nr:tetratricopeptide repeat protein [Alphaproteobacteria bacterium]
MSRLATDGEIAALNLDSACRQAWARFGRAPRPQGLAETIVDMERLKLQFFGDTAALDRLETLARVDGSPLVQAAAASAAHRFDEARRHLARAPHEAAKHQLLSIDQACGTDLDAVLTARRRLAGAGGRLEDLVPLGAVLADLERFAEAATVYREAHNAYSGTSPFPLAWVCFQLGQLWGELMPEPDLDQAAQWYRSAVAYLPFFPKARVHLAEIYLGQGQASEAEALLLPVLSSRDPEVRWRLGDVLLAQGRLEEAKAQLEVARLGFEELLERHLLAFADHAAEFYAGSGNDPRRALALARTNAANRPTRRAMGQAHALEAAA